MAPKKRKEAYKPVEAVSNPRLSALENELNRIQVEQKNREAQRKEERGKRSVGQKIGEFFMGKKEKPEYHSPFGPEEQASKNLLLKQLTPLLMEEYQREVEQGKLPLGEQLFGPQGYQFAQSMALPILQQASQGPSQFPTYGGNSLNDLLPAILGSLAVPYAQNYFKGGQEQQQMPQQQQQQQQPNQLDQLLQQMNMGPQYENFEGIMQNPQVNPQLKKLLAMPQAQKEPLSHNQRNVIREQIKLAHKRQHHPSKGFVWKNGMWR